MAISYDNSVEIPYGTTGSISADLTVGTDANMAVIVAVYYNPNTSGDLTATCGGVSMNWLKWADYPSSGLSGGLFYLLGVGSGSKTITITAPNARPLIGCAASYKGVVAVDSANYVKDYNATAGTLTSTVNITVANSWIVLGVASNGAMAAGSGATARKIDTYTACGIMDSNADLGTGNQTIAATNSSNNGLWNTALAMQPTAPSTGTTTPTPQLLTLGVG